MKKTLISERAGARLDGRVRLMPKRRPKRIAFSNNYAGNSWRQAMLNS